MIAVSCADAELRMELSIREKMVKKLSGEIDSSKKLTQVKGK